jgi:hypothetical protein
MIFIQLDDLELVVLTFAAYSELSTRCTGDRRQDCFDVGLVVWRRWPSDISVCYRPLSFCGYGNLSLSLSLSLIT